MRYVEPEPIRVIPAAVARAIGSEVLARLNATITPPPTRTPPSEWVIEDVDDFDSDHWGEYARVRRRKSG